MLDFGASLNLSILRQSQINNFLNKHDESTQINNALKKYQFMTLNEKDEFLLIHDLCYIFSQLFYDFDNGTINENINFISSNQTDYLLYFSFFPKLKPQVDTDVILKDILENNSKKLFLKELDYKLTPYSFAIFSHNLVDSINIISLRNDYPSVKCEMWRQLITNSKELSLLPDAISLHNNLLTKIKDNLKNVTDDMEKYFSYHFTYAFFKTIYYKREKQNDTPFENMKNKIYDILYPNPDQKMKKKISLIESQFSDTNHIINYHTHLFQRLLCKETAGHWIQPKKISDARQRIVSMSKKVGEIIGGAKEPIGNAVIRINFPEESNTCKNLQVSIHYSEHEFVKIPSNGMIECVIPCFSETPVDISFKHHDKEDKIQIDKLDKTVNETRTIKFSHKKYEIKIFHEFYKYDEPIKKIHNELNNDPTNLFDFIIECFVRVYLENNRKIEVVQRNYNDDLENIEYNEDYNLDNENIFQKDKKKLAGFHFCIIQDILGSYFPIEFWIFLCDIAFKYAIPSSYFFGRLSFILNKFWCKSQAYLNLYCTVLYCFYYSLQNSDHSKKDEKAFDELMTEIHKKSRKLLLKQLAQPETFQRPSITSLMLIISLSDPEKNLTQGSKKICDEFEKIFAKTIENINNSILDYLNFVGNEDECTQMEEYLFNIRNKISKNPISFPLGPNKRHQCKVEIKSLLKTAEVIYCRCLSIYSFCLDSFISNSEIPENTVRGKLMEIFINIAQTFIKAFDNINDLVLFLKINQKIYDFFDKPLSLNPCEILKDQIYDVISYYEKTSSDEFEKSIKEENFESNYENQRIHTSNTFTLIILILKSWYEIVKELKPTYSAPRILQFCAKICNQFSMIIISNASSYYRYFFEQSNKPTDKIEFRNSFFNFFGGNLKSESDERKKTIFPSWCLKSEKILFYPFKNLVIMINDLSGIKEAWMKYLNNYAKYFPNNPQIVGKKSRKTELTHPVDDDCEISVKSYDIDEYEILNNTSILFDEPFENHKEKVDFMLNFLRLELTLEIKDFLDKKMWNAEPNMTIKEDFLDRSLLSSNRNSIYFSFNEIYKIFDENLEIVLKYLRESLRHKAVYQLVRGVEDGIFECLIPLVYSKQPDFFYEDNKIGFMFDQICELEDRVFSKVNSFVQNDCFLYRNYLNKLPKELNFLKEELKKQTNLCNGSDNYKTTVIKIVIKTKFPSLLSDLKDLFSRSHNFSFISLYLPSNNQEFELTV